MDVADFVDRGGKMLARLITAKPKVNRGNKRLVEGSVWGPFKGRRMRVIFIVLLRNSS